MTWHTIVYGDILNINFSIYAAYATDSEVEDFPESVEETKSFFCSSVSIFKMIWGGVELEGDSPDWGRAVLPSITY
jgi:hypothetical protein